MFSWLHSRNLFGDSTKGMPSCFYWSPFGDTMKGRSWLYLESLWRINKKISFRLFSLAIEAEECSPGHILSLSATQQMECPGHTRSLSGDTTREMFSCLHSESLWRHNKGNVLLSYWSLFGNTKQECLGYIWSPFGNTTRGYIWRYVGNTTREIPFGYTRGMSSCLIGNPLAIQQGECPVVRSPLGYIWSLFGDATRGMSSWLYWESLYVIAA